MKYVYTLTAIWEDPYNKNALYPYSTLIGIYSSRKKAELAKEKDEEGYSVDNKLYIGKQIVQ